MAVSERRQNLARLREIARVAARHGFGYAFDRRPVMLRPDDPVDEAGEEGNISTRGPRLRAMLDELGPTFVKFGQLLSTRPDVVPPDIVAELRGLQDDVSPVSFDEVRRVVEQELGLTIAQAFEEFDEVPLAAASIGQVHRARLPGGQEVVVKVQRPEAERQISADLQLMYQAARVAKDRVKRLAFIDVVGLVDEFARGVRQELDYRVEARNAEIFRRSFAGDSTVSVPRVHWRQTTQRVLTLDRVEGVVLAHFDLGELSLEERRSLANRVAETWMKMVFVHGVFHGDPHPANIIVVDPDTVGLVDFGQVGQLSESDRAAAVRLFLDIVNQDFERLPRRLRELGVRYPRDLEDEFREQLSVLLQRYYGMGLSEIDARELIGEIFATIYRLQIELPARWVMLDKTIATLAGVGLEIFPDFNVFETARPYARRIVTDRYRPDRLAKRAQSDALRYTETLMEYPFQISEMLDQFKDGEVKITILLESFQDLIAKAQASVNRVALAVLAAAIFLGSSIIGAGVQDGPQLLGVNVLALPGIAVGIVLAVLLLIGLLRSSR